MQGGANFAAYYLAEGQLNHPELGCPVAALGADVTRASNPIKAAFDQGFNRVIDKLVQAEEGTPEEQRAAAMRKLSRLAGCLMIARATGVETSQAVLAACLQVPE